MRQKLESLLYRLRANLVWFPCKIFLCLLPSSLGLAQNTKLAESSPSSSAQKNVHRVKAASTAAVAATYTIIILTSSSGAATQQQFGFCSSHRDFSVICCPKTQHDFNHSLKVCTNSASCAGCCFHNARQETNTFNVNNEFTLTLRVLDYSLSNS